jgi:proteasome accessory factor B
VTLTPDDLALIGDVVARLEQLGDPTLTDDVRSAANKLAFDLPLYERIGTDVRLLDRDNGADPKLFELLGDALRNRKVVSFQYHKPGKDGYTERRVEPFGLFFINAHWYVAARDRTRDGIRNFRISRIGKPEVNKKKPQTPDYEIPAEFRLREHAKSKDAWDLGEAEPVVAEVEFVGTSGVIASASRIGEEVEDRTGIRRFPVRRLDTFARWLLSFGGDARPLSPPELVELYGKSARETLSLYRSEP